jgi:hypothetical protein
MAFNITVIHRFMKLTGLRLWKRLATSPAAITLMLPIRTIRTAFNTHRLIRRKLMALKTFQAFSISVIFFLLIITSLSAPICAIHVFPPPLPSASAACPELVEGSPSAVLLSPSPRRPKFSLECPRKVIEYNHYIAITGVEQGRYNWNAAEAWKSKT